MTCPRCATPAAPGDRFCGSCGGPLFEVPETAVGRVAIPRGVQADGPCDDCGNTTFADGYCAACGHRRAEPDRDEAQLGAVTLITDRGLLHPRNEDAAAAGTLADGMTGLTAIAVAVCDGVSTSGEAHVAAVAASVAGVDAMLAALATAGPARTAVLAGLAAAAQAAAASGTGVSDPTSAPSCTYTAATVVTKVTGIAEITVGNVGDSRAYWLPRPPEAPRQLTVDDSLSQELMTAGASADSEAVRNGAHTLTRWLGADAEPVPWSESGVQTIRATGAGWLLLCSDGLWNYLPDGADIARFQAAGADPVSAARALTDHALACGGHDNITVAIIPIEGAP